VYIGNDVNDLACMRRVGCAARIVLTEDGGRGAVRELCDLILPTL